ncbi:MAG TPA: thioredoxin domain-containing protein, partial [Solirubrobacterales bacterium]|nr:thioredoxin domain-containing protein [Solirubrobacterales bacterium]
KDNPVDWYPWGEEALSRARDEDRPMILSIGYSACHWCHVMERESFEDEATAALMNEHFVPLKVDREERPDIDAIYMEACQAMTGQGGWPLNVFLTPDQVPFYAGTYFPPDDRGGMPSWRRVIAAVANAWDVNRDEIRSSGDKIAPRLQGGAGLRPAEGEPDPGALDAAAESLRQAYDAENGGFGGAPKFPPASALELLLARGEDREVVELTLDAMLAGGIYDQLGGGFARYSVDAVWLVPHFEKMLYDNALLARAYLHGWQDLGHERYRRVCEETLDWMLREMRGPEGGFYSALDADSEGEEGRFYVWFPEQIRELLREGEENEGAAPTGDGGRAGAEAVIEHYGVSERGNFEGANILHLAAGAEAEPPPGLDAARQTLYEARAKRVWPGLDDKRLTSWNALAIAAFAEAGAVLGREDYLDAARQCAGFVLGSLRDEQGRLLRTYKDGDARLNAYLEDHAFLLEALLTLYESSFEPRWFEAARALGDELIARFADPERGGFFSTSDDHEELIARRKEVGDHPIPAGNSSAALGLLRLEALTGEREYGNQAEGVLRLFAKTAVQHPESFAHLLRALDFYLEPTREVALISSPDAGSVAEDVAELAAVVRSSFRPRLVLAAGPEGGEQPPLLAGRTMVDGAPAAYACQNFACELPVSEPERLRELL